MIAEAARPETLSMSQSRSGRRPRLLLIQTQAENAGAQEISRLLSRGLAQRGYEVHQLFFFRRTAGFDKEPNTTFCASERPRTPLALLRLLAKLRHEIRRLQPDAVLCFQHYGNVIAGPIARLAGARVVIANQNSGPAHMNRAVRLLDRWLGAGGAFSSIVSNSADAERDYVRHPARYRARMRRIDHGFQAKESRIGKKQARSSFGLPIQGVLLGSVARLHPTKHLDAAIRLLALRPSWHLALAGQGASQGELEALAEELGCAGRLHFVGELAPARVGDFLATLDVFVFPSRAETFGLAPVEAAAIGLPVVANDLPVLREVLAMGEEPAALFVDVDDSEAFAGAVDRFLADPALAATLTARGRRLKERYPLDGMVDAYDALIRDLLRSRKGTPACASR